MSNTAMMMSFPLYLGFWEMKERPWISSFGIAPRKRSVEGGGIESEEGIAFMGEIRPLADLGERLNADALVLVVADTLDNRGFLLIRWLDSGLRECIRAE